MYQHIYLYKRKSTLLLFVRNGAALPSSLQNSSSPPSTFALCLVLLTRAPLRRSFKHPRDDECEYRAGRPHVPSENLHGFPAVAGVPRVVGVPRVSPTTASIAPETFTITSRNLVRRRAALHVFFVFLFFFFATTTTTTTRASCLSLAFSLFLSLSLVSLSLVVLHRAHFISLLRSIPQKVSFHFMYLGYHRFRVLVFRCEGRRFSFFLFVLSFLSRFCVHFCFCLLQKKGLLSSSWGTLFTFYVRALFFFSCACARVFASSSVLVLVVVVLVTRE